MRQVFLSLLGVICVLVCGCEPGSATFTLKTSEIQKALSGGVGRVQVHQQFHIDMSNEFSHVISTQKVLTNDVEVTRQLLKDLELADGKSFREFLTSNTTVRMWIDQGTNQWPQLYVDAKTEVLLCSTNCFKDAGEGVYALGHDAVDCLRIESDDGKVYDDQGFMSFGGPMGMLALAYCEGLGTGLNIGEGKLPDIDKGFRSRFNALSRAIELICSPAHMDERHCIIIGDQESPIYLESSGVIVKGSAVSSLCQPIHKGDRVEFSMIKGRRGPAGHVRFSIKPIGVK